MRVFPMDAAIGRIEPDVSKRRARLIGREHATQVVTEGEAGIEPADGNIASVDPLPRPATIDRIDRRVFARGKEIVIGLIKEDSVGAARTRIGYVRYRIPVLPTVRCFKNTGHSFVADDRGPSQ